jgi:ABC-2 type transport system ATP-binding protein
MNILCGVLNQTEGNVFINGINLRKKPEEAKRNIGFLPQVPPLHPDLTVDEYLTHCAHLRKMPRAGVPAAVSMAKEKCGIAHFSKRLIRNLSGGYRQRVGIAQAIIHTPMLVVLDEPTNGLDPNQIMEIRNLIREIALDRSVIFSSHILSEIQATCRDIKMIEHGRMVFSDTIEAFNNYIEPRSLLVYLVSPPSPQELMEIPGITGVEFLSPRHIRLRFDTSREITQTIVELSVQKRWQLQEISFEKSSADAIFAKLSNKSLN